MHPDFTGSVGWMPMQHIRFIMKSMMILRIDDLLTNNTYDGVMIKVMDQIGYWAGICRMAGERHGN